MPSDWAKAELASIREDFAERMRQIGDLQRKRVALTASSSVLHGRITVTVNADGTVVETRFAANIGDLTYTEIASGVTQAAQTASAEVARKVRELMQPLHEGRGRMPKLSAFVEGLDEFETLIPVAPPVSTAPPRSEERPAEKAMEFTDVEDYEKIKRRSGGPGIVDRGR
jgi:hypothetical protein